MDKRTNEQFETLDEVQSEALVGGMAEMVEADGGEKTLSSTGTYGANGGDVSVTVDYKW